MKRKTSLSRQMFRAIACLLTATQLLLTLLCILFTVRTSRQRTLTDQKNLLLRPRLAWVTWPVSSSAWCIT